MLKYIVKRILQAIPLMIIITALCFSLIHLAPYDAVDAITTDKMTQEEIDAKREEYGLNDPIYVQYFCWLRNVLKGELGYSLINRTNIADDLAVKIPNTIKLVLPSYLTAFGLAIVLGLISGYKKNGLLDKLINGLASVGLSVPTFWVALLIMYFFGCKLNWFPIFGQRKTPLPSFLIQASSTRKISTERSSDEPSSFARCTIRSAVASIPRRSTFRRRRSKSHGHSSLPCVTPSLTITITSDGRSARSVFF